jgi:hypothetical protein
MTPDSQSERGVMEFDFNKLSQGAKLALIGGAVLIINLFLPWYSVGAGGFRVSLNAFDAEFYAWGGSFLAIAGAVVLLLKATGGQAVGAGQFKTEQLATILAAAGTVLIILRFLTESSATSFGLFLGVAASAVVTYGSFSAMRDEGLDLPGMNQSGGDSGSGDDM